ncbi:MAG: peptide chain release factor N(5)-glutamine methyltransferase [Deltaproteobacteria bacterium]|nr:peptide chain release factor N(5)-glutamine methyltransferase [Deltaproteobacteria bacterium]
MTAAEPKPDPEKVDVPWTLLKVLDWTKAHFESRGITTARLDAELILARVLKMERIMLYARFDQPLRHDELAAIRALVARRARREPLAYILGEREFWSLTFEVSPAVLIPRPDTETLVEVTLDVLRGVTRPVIIDVGTGSGCVATALAKERPDATVYALEISDEACAIAHRNRDRHGLTDRIQIFKSDLLGGLPRSVTQASVIWANLPYIPEASIDGLMPEVRAYEPRGALTGGQDGLDLIRRLVHESRARFEQPIPPPMTLEADPGQMTIIADLLRAGGHKDVRLHEDAARMLRVASAR